MPHTGAGYTLTVTPPEAASNTANAATDLLQQLRTASPATSLRESDEEHARSDKNAHDDLHFQVPPQDVVAVAELMDRLQDTGAVGTFGLTVPSLADVFIKLRLRAEEAEEEAVAPAAAQGDRDSGRGGGDRVRSDAKSHDRRRNDDGGGGGGGADNDDHDRHFADVVGMKHRRLSTGEQISLLYSERWQLASKRCSMFISSIIVFVGLALGVALSFIELTTPATEVVRSFVRSCWPVGLLRFTLRQAELFALPY